MSNRGLRLEGRTTFPDRRSRVLAVCLVIGLALMIASRNMPSPVDSRPGCGADPWDFLHVGEIVESSSLAFIVEAHCRGARYSPQGRIEMSYGGGRVDVEVRRIDIAGTTYFKVVSIGGVRSPL